ncbi:MAG: energy-coupled thiamine transporter ThiT [Oscillospiraceae bacterium]|jgi:thiamine transporter|nr:energy-coupled thiamine transporter ThiT [Oscillospiraceae bacterium]
MNTSKKTLMLCEGAVCVALSVALSYLKIDVGAQGGSLNFTMIPLILFAVHIGGVSWGVLAGFVFGTLKFFLAEGFAINWESMLLDYSVAYAAVGLAGLMKDKGPMGYLVGALIGCFARFIIHWISGVTIYAEYAEGTYLGVNTEQVWWYSAIYNGFYMAFNTVAAVIITPVIGTALDKVRLTERKAA